MNVYFISGIGADCRIFKNIELPPSFHAVYLDWIKPLPDESLKSYALRLAASIRHEQPFVLVGLSFGGMLATEIAKIYPPAHLILISSIPSSLCLPVYLRFAARLRLQKLVPISLLKSASLLKRLFTAETREEKKFLRRAIRESDPQFIRWSLNAIVTWTSEELPASCTLIHGSRDELLPLKYTKPTHVIKGGGHLMVLTKAKEISQIIRDTLSADVSRLQAHAS